MSDFQLTTTDVAMLINRKVIELQDIVRDMHHTPIRSKQAALPIIVRIQELLELIPNPATNADLEIKV